MADKFRILFVDDEPLVLNGLRRSLFAARTEWSMAFATSGIEALRIMERESFDVLVTDMRMPGMDGSQLLQAVKARYPQTIRIVLSGQSSRDALLESIAPSHQFLSKPCTAEELKQRIASAFALRDLLENSIIKNLIGGLGSVPALPALYHEVVEELQAPEPCVAKLAAIISRDPAMTAKILQLANSALFGVRSHVSDARQAVTLIGLEMIQALVVSVHIFSHFDSQQVKQLNIAHLWKHSLATASCSRAIAASEHVTKSLLEDCFTAGLLHDVGKLILMGSLPDEYSLAIEHATKDNISLLQAELDSFGCSHAEVGAYLIGIWGLPHAIVEAVAWHHLPSRVPAKGLTPVTAVHMADALLSATEFGHLPPDYCFDRNYLEQIGLAEREHVWRQVCEQTVETLKSREGWG